MRLRHPKSPIGRSISLIFNDAFLGHPQSDEVRKYNPAASASENPVANFVPEGYESVQVGDYYIVREK